MAPELMKLDNQMQEEPEIDDSSRMSVIEHLEELRRRIVVSVLAITGGSVAGWFLVPPVLRFISRPIGGRLVFVAPTEAFMAYLKLAVTLGMVLAAPVILVELWLYILPGLYPHEAKFFRRYIPLIVGLFVSGIVFSLLVVYPVMIHFLLRFEQGKLHAVMNVGKYLNFLTSLLVPFGFVFEFPLVIVILVKLGFMSHQTLREGRKMAYLLILVGAAILTPPDVISQLLMAIPLMLLYELGLLMTRKMKSVQETWSEEEEDNGPGEGTEG